MSRSHTLFNRTTSLTPEKFKELAASMAKIVEANPRLLEIATQFQARFPGIVGQLAQFKKQQAVKVPQLAQADESENEMSLRADLGLRNRRDPSQNIKKPSHTVTIESTDAQPQARRSVPYQVPSFTKSMLSAYIQNIFGLPGLAVLGLGSLGVAAAQSLPAGLEYASGYGTGTDQCGGLWFCVQGVINNITSQTTVAQFSQVINQVGQYSQIPSQLAMQSCLGDKLEDVATSTLNAVSDWMGTLTCSSESGIWWSTQVSGGAVGLSDVACTEFENLMNSAASHCQNVNTGGVSFGIGLGISVGAIVALVLLVALCAGSYVLCCTDRPSSSRRSQWDANNNSGGNNYGGYGPGDMPLSAVDQDGVPQSEEQQQTMAYSV